LISAALISAAGIFNDFDFYFFSSSFIDKSNELSTLISSIFIRLFFFEALNYI
jgi:hypothetical protein